MVARLGGDEFGILMSAVEPAEARAAANDLLSAIRSSPVMYGDKPFRVTASIGAIAFESDEATASDLLVNADLAMYAAKTSGRDRVVVYTAAEAAQGARDGQADLGAADPGRARAATASSCTCSRSWSWPAARSATASCCCGCAGTAAG